MKKLFFSFLLLFSLQSFANVIIFKATMIENMSYFSEGAQVGLGVKPTDILLFDSGDKQGLVFSCEDQKIEYYTKDETFNIHLADKSMCNSIHNKLISYEYKVNSHNTVNFIFDDKLTKLYDVIFP
jgi:hypothetical protein